MAKIPNADALDEPNVNAVAVRTGENPRVMQFDEAAFTAGNRADAAAGKALGNLGDGIEDFGLALQKRQDEEDDYEMQKRFVDFDVSQEKRLVDMQMNPAKDAKGFTTEFGGAYDADAKTFFKEVPDRLKAKYDVALVKRRGNYTERAYKFEVGERDRQHREDLDTKLLDLRNITAVNPDSYQDNIARGVSIIASARLPPSDKSKAMKAFAQGVEEDAVRARVDRGDDIGQVIKDLKARPGAAEVKEPEPIVGLITSGNIDLTSRHVVQNDDGTISTLKSMSFQEGEGKNKREVLIPTLDPQGKQLTEEGAIALYKETGQHLGIFDSPDNATAFAKRLSHDMDELATKGIDGDEPRNTYRHLKPDQRLRLINVARLAGRASIQGEIEDDLVHIKATGQPNVDAHGKTSLQKGIENQFLTPMQAEKYKRAWDAAHLEHEAVAPLNDLDPDLQEEHIGKVFDKAWDAGDEEAAETVRKRANRATDEIAKARKVDPARSVNDAPEVQAAISTARNANRAPRMVDGGEVDAGWAVPPQKAWEMVIDARLTAQRRRGIDGPQALTRKEAFDLMGGSDISRLPVKEYTAKLKEMGPRATEQYGPKHARAAVASAIHYMKLNAADRAAAEKVLSKIAVGERLTPDDLRETRAASHLLAADRIFNPDTTPEVGRGAMQQPLRLPAGPAAFNGAKAAGSYPKPPPQAILDLQNDPSTWTEFARTFGEAAAQAALAGKVAPKGNGS